MQQRRCRWTEEKKAKREKPHVLNVGGRKNNCKLLITRQACVRPSDHLLTQKMRALECERAHNFSACVTGEERKTKLGGGWMEGKGTEALLVRRRRRRKRRQRNRSRRRRRRRMPDGFGWRWKTAEEGRRERPLCPLPGSRSMTSPIWSQSLNSWQLPETPQPISCAPTAKAPTNPALVSWTSYWFF